MQTHSITVASSETEDSSLPLNTTRSNSVLIPPPMGMSNTAHLAWNQLKDFSLPSSYIKIVVLQILGFILL